MGVCGFITAGCCGSSDGSCWGFVPEDLQIVFEPVMTMSTKDQMEIAKQHAEFIQMMISSGAITPEQAREELKAWSERTGVFTKI